ncbi:uncharacterized protein LOC132631110 [Lycium barbarum]|uniref:uncharacterized protein LOC132631110 n=1 Tax=Lycium barbarum TaxID=112863 RepID=UPI00293EC733|nr:uncharacterized protein LOC132631110 [Lycium barbarum]
MDTDETRCAVTGKQKTLDTAIDWNMSDNPLITKGSGSIDESSVVNVKITMDDIQEEVVFWPTAVVCYVLGSNPALTVIEGYFKCIWRALDIDKVAQVNRGVFLVRFDCMEDRSKAIDKGIQMFDRKPIVVNGWEPDVEMNKTIVEKVPVWVRLEGLELKYWGQTALTKIASLIGKPLKIDNATNMRERLMYARRMVEVTLNQACPDFVMFENEKGQVIEQEVTYEWRPVLCAHCKNFGHTQELCRK